MNRIKLLAGDKVANRMSWNLINREEISVRGRHKRLSIIWYLYVRLS